MKIVINKCYGGFSISDKAIRRYAELKGITLYPEKEKHGFIAWWIVPPEQRVSSPTPEEWQNASQEERIAHNKAYSAQSLSPREIERNDLTLVQVIEELGTEANGSHAALSVIEIPDDVKWEIEEYDGIEWVAEQHRTWQ